MRDLYIDMEFPLSSKGVPIRDTFCEVALTDSKGNIIINTLVKYNKKPKVGEKMHKMFGTISCDYEFAPTQEEIIEVIMEELKGNKLYAWGVADMLMLRKKAAQYNITFPKVEFIDLEKEFNKVLKGLKHFKIGLIEAVDILGVYKRKSHKALDDTLMLVDVHEAMQKIEYKEVLFNRVMNKQIKALLNLNGYNPENYRFELPTFQRV